MDLQSLMRECFSTCSVNNGVISFGRNLTNEELMSVYSQFSKDLLNCNIPHFRIIGFYHCWDDKHQHSIFRRNDAYGMSLIELGHKMQDLIPIEIGGNDPERGCFYGEDENLNNHQFFNEGYGRSPSMKASTRRTNALKLPSTEIGSIMCDVMCPPDSDSNEWLSAKTVWYTQFSTADEALYPTMLLPDVIVAKLNRTEADDSPLIMFIKKGTGRLDYEDTQALFDEGYENIMPCRVNYDLSKYFTCKYPNTGDSCLRLAYHDKVNEAAVTYILQDYGKAWCER